MRPVALAGERLLEVGGPLGAVQRGSVLAVEGPLGAGVMSAALSLAAAATAGGEWAAVLETGPVPTVGAAAAHEAGVALERLAVVTGVERGQWGSVLAALVEGVSVVVAEPPPGGVRPVDARRLLPRLRARGAVVVCLGPWPERAVRIELDRGERRWASAR